jgi:hypothetical protein
MIIDYMTNCEIVTSYCDRFGIIPTPELMSVIDPVRAKRELVKMDLKDLLGTQGLMDTYRDLAHKYNMTERRVRQLTQKSGNGITTH